VQPLKNFPAFYGTLVYFVLSRYVTMFWNSSRFLSNGYCGVKWLESETHSTILQNVALLKEYGVLILFTFTDV
jgi:hypothetical protein